MGLRLWFALNLLEKEVEMLGIIEQKSIRAWSRLTVCLGIVESQKNYIIQFMPISIENTGDP